MLVEMEGFDEVSTAFDISALLGKWDEATHAYVVSSGRHGQGIGTASGSGRMRRALSASEQDDVVIVGMALRVTGLDATYPILVLSGDAYTTHHVSFRLNADGQVEAYRGGSEGSVGGATLLGTSTDAIQAGVFSYLEFKVKLHDSTGTITVRLDGTTILSLTGIDTKNGGTAAVFDNVTIGLTNTGYEHFFDDIYILNEQGSTNNDFLGDVWVETLFPNGNGNSSQFVGSDGNSVDNYALVDETGDPNTADYVESGVVGDKDTYAFTNLSTTAGSVFAAKAWVRAKKTDTGTRSLALVARSGTSETDGSDQALATTDGWYGEMYENKPGGTGWTISEVNAAEFGHKAR